MSIFISTKCFRSFFRGLILFYQFPLNPFLCLVLDRDIADEDVEKEEEVGEEETDGGAVIEPTFDFAPEYQVRPVDDPRGTRERQLNRDGRRRDATARPRPAGRAHLRQQPLDSWRPSLPLSSMFQAPWRRYVL